MAYNDKQTGKNKHFLEAFRHAFDGIKVAIVEERNLKIHLIISVIMICLAVVFHFSRIEWLVLSLTIGLVIILEMINTLVENLVDLVTDCDYHPLAKKVKDIAAGVVLTSSLLAVIIGIILFLPKILR